MCESNKRYAAARDAVAAGDGVVVAYEWRERPSTVPGHVTRERIEVEVEDEAIIEAVRAAVLRGTAMLYHDGQLGVMHGGQCYRIRLSRPGYESAAYRRAIGIEEVG